MLVLNRHQVPADYSENQRISDYLIGVFPQLPSKKSIKKAIKKELLRIDNQPITTALRVQPNWMIELIEQEEGLPKTYEISLEKVHEEVDFALINKPAGLAVSGNFYRTVQNALPHNLSPSTAIDALTLPRPVHRLDAPTSGLLLIAKTASAHLHLSKQFEHRKVEKVYHAIVIGKTPPNATLTNSIDGHLAQTYFETLRTVRSLKNDYLSLVAAYPKTGRTHQIRRHLSEFGFPILGDAPYGKAGLILKHKGLFLTAVQLGFLHPKNEDFITFKLETPYKFKSLLDREQRRWERYVEK